MVTSNDLAGSMKPRVFKELKVTNFGGSFNSKDEYYWMAIQFSYKHFDGGLTEVKYVIFISM